MSDTPLIGERIRSVRTAAGERREHLAVAIGRSTETVTLYERGRICPPLPVLATIAAHYDIDLTELVAGGL